MTSAVIAEGDQVIFYGSRDSIHSARIESGKVFGSRYGQYSHSDMIGKRYGSKVPSMHGRGFIYLLRPTPELWTLALPHRTQILYAPDIAFISSYLNVTGGSTVIEAGTGSGSFTHSLSRNIGDTGRVYSFEFNEERYQKASDEFKANGIDRNVTLQHRNVCKDGFGDDLDSKVDSVFLDLPAPWEAVSRAKKALKKDRAARICCFSPCIEQVLKTVAALRENGFADVSTYETLLRQYEPATITLPPISTASERLKYIEYKKEKRRQSQIALAAARKKADQQAAASTEEGDANQDDGPATKKAKVESGNREEQEDWNLDPPPDLPMGDKVTSYKVATLSRGHTSFLTFATLLPSHLGVTEEVTNGAPQVDVAV